MAPRRRARIADSLTGAAQPSVLTPFGSAFSEIGHLKSRSRPCITWNLSDAAPNPPSQPKPRGWSLVAAGLLLLALALVVLFTSRQAFSSPLALVVVAAIGLAGLLLQLRLRKDRASVHAPLWLNVIAVVFAVAAFIADVLHLAATLLLITALGAVICFAASGIVVLHALRKTRT